MAKTVCEAWGGASFRLLDDLAQIYTITGEPDLALDALDDLLARPMDAISVVLLKIDPTWPPLREHPSLSNAAAEIFIWRIRMIGKQFPTTKSSKSSAKAAWPSSTHIFSFLWHFSSTLSHPNRTRQK